jgi:hypothetical protein
MSLRHHLIFDGAVMAQIGLRRHQSVPKKKRWRRCFRHLVFSDGAPMAQWRTEPRRPAAGTDHRQGGLKCVRS